jgi:hypothetical protein
MFPAIVMVIRTALRLRRQMPFVSGAAVAGAGL